MLVRLGLILITTMVASNSLAVEITSLGNHQEEIRKHVVSHCSANQTPEQIKECLVSSGEMFIEVSEHIKNEPSSPIIGACQEKTSRLENNWFFFIRCAQRQINIRKKNPFPQLSMLEFKKDDYLALWLLQCRKSSQQTLSKCLNEKEAEYQSFWVYYNNLADSEAKAKAFAACLDTSQLSEANFRPINACLNGRVRE